MSIPQGESQETITATGIIEAYGKMGYDAVAVGPFDLVAGIDFLKKLNNHHFSWLSANLLNSDNSPVFHPFIIKKTGQSKTGIIGLTNPSATLPSDLHIADWHTVLPAQLQALSKECDHVILLSNLSVQENNEIAKNYPGLRIIISADPKFGNLNPILTNNTLITQTANQGKYLGTLTIEWGNSDRWKSDREQELSALNNRVDSINLMIRNLEKQKNSSPDITQQLEQMGNDRQDVVRQIESLNEKEREDTLKGIQASTFTSNVITLTSSMPDRVDINSIISSIKQQINTMNRSPEQNTVIRSATTPLKTTQAATDFTGYEQCRTCHSVQTDFWKSTRHAGSYIELQNGGQAHNLECLPCHVTHDTDFFKKDSGDMTELLSLQPSMQAVGCEVCHGAGRAHTDTPEKILPVRRPAKHVCLNCHTKERDTKFNYEEKIKWIQCPAG